MRLPFLFAAVVVSYPALASDADCERARDHHADFKAVLDNDSTGKAQFETVKRGSDGIVTVTRWVDGNKRIVRHTLRGLFTKETEIIFGTRTNKMGFVPNIDVSKLFPLQPNSSAQYRVSIGQS